MSFNQDPMQEHIRQGVALRSRVNNMVHNDIGQAYDLAKSIKHPWYRCQALAEVAKHSSRTSIIKILKESFDSAMDCHDPNRRVSVACRPLCVAIDNGLRELCNVFLNQCIDQIRQNMDPISKWCVVSVVHTIKKDYGLLHNFYDAFASATSMGHGWRVEREIKYMLNDPDIKKDGRYISHLSARHSAIADWKKANALTK